MIINIMILLSECIGLRNIVIMMYIYLTMLYLINDLNWIELNLYNKGLSLLNWESDYRSWHDVLDTIKE